MARSQPDSAGRLVTGAIVAAIIAISVAAGLAAWRSPRVVAWRYRGREVEPMLEIIAVDSRAPPPESPARALELHRLGLGLARSEDPGKRLLAVFYLASREIRELLGAAELRAADRALADLLADRSTYADGQGTRVCDYAGQLVEGKSCVNDLGASVAERDAACAAARARLAK